MRFRLRFATNRNPEGAPVSAFGKFFNPTHPHELRLGEIVLDCPKPRGSGSDMAEAFEQHLAIGGGGGGLVTYSEDLSVDPPVLGSSKMFAELKADMDKGVATVLFIHGYNVSFRAAVASALALQERLSSRARVNVVLFSWPSDGSMVLFEAYKNDRDDAAASGLAFSRGFQKLFGYLSAIARPDHCGSAIHLVCHSMGNFVLENALWHLRKNLSGRLPRIFTEIVLASADVDSDALEQEAKLGRLSEIAGRVTVYFNRGDEALRISDFTKGNPDRLGQSGPKHPLDVPAGVVNVDCTEVVGGLVEHGYFLDEASGDLTETLAGRREDAFPLRRYVASANAYRLIAAKKTTKKIG